jgi:hypothetical protein
MRFLLPLVLLCGIACEPSIAAEPNTDPFAKLNGSFISTYSALAEKNQKATRPILITTGASWELLCEDGSTKHSPPANPVEMRLKASAHVCAYLYAIAENHWRDPAGGEWKDQMNALRQNLEDALSQVDNVSWASDAWPGGEAKLRDFMRESLTTARDFASSTVAKGDLTPEEFETFAKKYTPTIRSAFYLNSLSNAFDLLKTLRQWKAEMGLDAWSRMRVIIAAGKGRSTAGLTAETNPAALIAASVMDADKVKTNLLMSPGAATTDEALSGLALALTSYKLADAFKGDPDAVWYYTSLKQPNIPVALDPVRNALKGLLAGDAKDPILGIGPKK